MREKGREKEGGRVKRREENSFTSLMVPLGCCMLDVKASTFPNLAEVIVERLVERDLLTEKRSEQVKTLLLKKHKHNDDTSLWDKIRGESDEVRIKPSLD